MGMDFGDLVSEIRATRDAVASGDTERDRILKGIRSDVDRLSLRVSRPGHDSGPINTADSASDYLQLRHQLKAGPQAQPIAFSSQEIDQASIACKAFASFVRGGGDFGRMIEPEKKALTEFTLGNLGVIVPPELSDKILSCLSDPGDLTGVVGNMSISSSPVQFLQDNVDGAGLFSWACESDCAGALSAGEITKGLGQVELKPDELRGMICASRSFLEDVAINIDTWIAQKGQQGVRRIASHAIAVGTGVGMPMGILNPASGIPICATSANTPAGTIAWQDLCSRCRSSFTATGRGL